MNKRAATLFALGFTTAALAQQPGSQPVPTQPRAAASEQRPATRQERESAQQRVPLFIEADKNKDGVLSRQEASAVQGLDFAAADTNKNLSLDLGEYTAAAAKLRGSPRQ